VDGLREPVTVTRDQWGIPHIVAANTDDLFFAQGFVQAQDRLFQMDLWKRSSQGRLSEVLGANFIQRDSMTRRIQFRGDLEREWASYGPDAHRIAIAFTNGINAWVRIARRDPPEEFGLAGWQPEFWRPEDLLNRTDAFMASTGALVELIRARLVASIGLKKATALLPSRETGGVQPDPEVDLSAITFVVSDAVRRFGTPPFFLTLAGKASDAPRPGQPAVGSQPPAIDPAPKTPTGAGDGKLAELPAFISSRPRAWVDSGKQTASGGPGVVIEIGGAPVAPSRAYLVHLTAPGWNVIGAARPWLPGVVFGHNERIAWAMAPLPVDTQDIAVERVNPADPHQVWHQGRWVDMSVDFERVAVKGRDQPVEYQRRYTSNGVVIAQDEQRGLVYTLRWTGTEPGGAGELSALNLGRADSWDRFRETIDRWIAPPSHFVYADVDGVVGQSDAGLVPRRRQGRGALPVAGWSSDRIWSSFTPLSAGAGALNSPGDLHQSDPSGRPISEVLELRSEALARTLKFFYGVRRLALEKMDTPDELRDDILYAVEPTTSGTGKDVFVGGDPMPRDLLNRVQESIEPSSTEKQKAYPVTFQHPLSVFDTSRRRFNVSVILSPIFGLTTKQEAMLDPFIRPSFRAVFTANDWNRSIAINAPGQSGSPASTNYDDMAVRWASADDVPLAFDQSKASPEAREVLTLQPREAQAGPGAR
jgi:acyl-homoserine lactone acylase PvdQ